MIFPQCKGLLAKVGLLFFSIRKLQRCA